MLEFYKTGGGRRFFDGHVPAFIEAVQRLATAAEQIVERIAAEPEPEPKLPMEIVIDPAWWKEHADPDYWGEYHLDVPTEAGGPGLSIRGGCSCHVTAIHVTDDSGIQIAANHNWQDELDAIGAAGGAEGRIDTIEVDGHECILNITPFC
jgi:hypothetical protein